MVNTGKCPKCGEVVRSVVVEHVDGGTSSFRGAASYVCPTCQAILGMMTAPAALIDDIVNEVVKRLGGK